MRSAYRGARWVSILVCFPITKDEAGLATVMAMRQPMPHAPWRRRMSEALLMQGGGPGLTVCARREQSAVAGRGAPAYGLGTKVGRELPHSRAQESEADRVGLTFMARAGYDPAECVAVWERLRLTQNRREGGASTPAIFRDHPADEKANRGFAEAAAAGGS